jgi:HlyD family secretion protein
LNAKRVVLGVALLGAVALALGFFWPFGRRPQTSHIHGVVEIQEVRLGSKIGGRVEKVEILEGDSAEPGQPLVFFAVPELQAQRQQLQARLLQAEADLEKAKNGPRSEEKEAARAALEAARARWERLKAGWREEEKRQARSEFETAEADLKLAREEFDRAERLYRQGSSSRADYDAARAARDRALGRNAAAQARWEMLQAGSRAEDIAEAAAQLKQAQANYDLLLAGTRPEDLAASAARVMEARGKLSEIDANLEEAIVRAPERVLVEVVAVRKGDLVQPNQPILRVLRAKDLWVKAYVPEPELGQVRLNQEAELTIDAYPDRLFRGTVMHIAAESEFTPRNVQSADERRHQVFAIKIRVADSQGVFKSGMAAEVNLPLQ